MKILFIASEVVPFAKTGGLADVAAALPKALQEIGHDIRIFMPRYKCVDQSRESAVTVDFFENASFADRDELYCLNGKDYPNNYQAFLSFCQAVLPFLKANDWRPDIIHCNDWQTGPVCLYLKQARSSDPFFKRTASVYSIHNMAYQGNFPGKMNFARAGIENADVINSVSETYAREIQTKEFGCGLEDLLRGRSRDVYGIVNGVDYELWDPAKDPSLVKRYSRMTLSLRSANKAALQKEMAIAVAEDIPLIGIISRLDSQKGFDLLAGAINDLMGLACQIVILGTGDPKYHRLLKNIKKKFPEKIGVKLVFDAALAQRIYAGSDMFLMPSRYEPCGLGQLISFKYGAVPIVRKTGGLADTVHDIDPKTGKGNGFVFKAYNAEAMLAAVKRAIEFYKNKAVWVKLQERIMAYDYSWTASAKKYISLYVKAVDKVLS